MDVRHDPRWGNRHQQYCDAKLKPNSHILIVDRRISLGENVDKCGHFAVVVSVVGADDYDVIENISNSGETMSNLADSRLNAGWLGTS